jgi:hypothetical protein
LNQMPGVSQYRVQIYRVDEFLFDEHLKRLTVGPVRLRATQNVNDQHCPHGVAASITVDAETETLACQGALRLLDKACAVRKFDATYHVDLTKPWSLLVSRREEYLDVQLVSAIYRVLKMRNEISGHGGTSRDPKNKTLTFADVLDAQLLARQLLIDCTVAK